MRPGQHICTFCVDRQQLQRTVKWLGCRRTWQHAAKEGEGLRYRRAWKHVARDGQGTEVPVYLGICAAYRCSHSIYIYPVSLHAHCAWCVHAPAGCCLMSCCCCCAPHCHVEQSTRCHGAQKPCGCQRHQHHSTRQHNPEQRGGGAISSNEAPGQRRADACTQQHESRGFRVRRHAQDCIL